MRVEYQPAFIRRYLQLTPADRQWVDALVWHARGAPFDHPFFDETRRGVRRAVWGAHFIVFYRTRGPNDARGLITFIDFARRRPELRGGDEPEEE